MKNTNNNKGISASVFFGERLKSLRSEKQLNQKQVAEKLGVAVSTYANWEQGRREPSLFDIFNLLSVLGISANDLFEDYESGRKNF